MNMQRIGSSHYDQGGVSLDPSDLEDRGTSVRWNVVKLQSNYPTFRNRNSVESTTLHAEDRYSDLSHSPRSKDRPRSMSWSTERREEAIQRMAEPPMLRTLLSRPPKVAENGQKSGLECGRKWPICGRKWPKFGKFGTFLAKFWQKFGKNRAKSGQFCPEWENY